MVTRAILLVAFVSLLFTGILRAGDAPILSGSKLETKDALKNSNVIFVGEVIQPRFVWGVAVVGNVNSNKNYDIIGADVKSLQALLSSVEGRVPLTITIHGGTYHEEPPAAMGRYIFFVHDYYYDSHVHPIVFTCGAPIYPGAERYDVLKLLPATDDNIAKVKKLISN